jgi:hypothetical protein
MGLAAWLDLEGIDVAVFMVAGVLGYFAGLMVPPGAWAVYTSILFSYHLFLGWLVFSGRHRAGISFSALGTIATHLACIAIIIPLGMARHYIPFFGIFRYGIAGMAIFERGWLFSATHEEPKLAEVPVAPIVMAATADDFEAWHRHLAQQKPGARRAGASLKVEYEQWLLARHGNRAVQAADDGSAGG